MQKIVFLFCVAAGLFLKLNCQVIDTSGVSPVHLKNLKFKKKKPFKADSLATIITAGKSGEKEKFDAIFSWVASNIEYDYQDYYSSGSFPKKISWILANKHAICLGYATLMDTLCAAAGITNVSVYGYAKDQIFDLNDSLYMDNHAWNAVKLDGQWYVYDVTWSTGQRQYELTRFSKFKLKLKKRFKPKYKNKKIKISMSNSGECSNPTFTTVTYLKQRFFNRLWQRIVYRLKLKGKYLHYQKINPDFYLGQPEVFGITHYADDAMWNLQPGKTIKEFEADSAYYYLADSVYKKQQRYGSDCAACDDYISKTQKEKLELLKKNAEKANRRNHFIAGDCDFELGQIPLIEQLSMPDDSLKWKTIVAAEKKFFESKTNFGKAAQDVKTETVLQRKKNRNKVVGLNRENRAHKRGMDKHKTLCSMEQRKYREIFNKSYALPVRYKKKISRERSFGSNMSLPKPGNNAAQNIARFTAEKEKAEKVIDSLQVIILTYRNEFDSLVANLSLNAEQKSKILDSMIFMVLNRSYYRSYLLDDMKKPVVDLRKKIMIFEKDYLEQVNKLIYEPAERGNYLFSEISRLVKIKQKKQEDCIKLTYALIKNGEGSPADLKVYKLPVFTNQHEDICWLVLNRKVMEKTKRGLAFMVKKQEEVNTAMRYENAHERHRSIIVARELHRRYLKHNAIAKANIRLDKMKLKYLKVRRKEVEKILNRKLKHK